MFIAGRNLSAPVSRAHMEIITIGFTQVMVEVLDKAQQAKIILNFYRNWLNMG